MKRTTPRWSTAVLVLTVAVSCAPVTGRGAVTVGAVYPTGGTHGAGGVEEYRGVELAVDYANRTGSPRFRLLLEPAETADAVPGAVRRLRDAGARVVLGSYGSTLSRPAAATASRLGIVYWETGAVGELSMQAALGRRVFRVPAAGGVLGGEAVAFVRDRLAPQMGRDDPLRWAVAYVDDVYGRSVGLGAISEAEASGHHVAARIAYDPASTDFDDLAGQVLRSRADVLAVAAYLEDGIELRRAVLRAGIPLLANIGTSSSYCMIEFGARLGDDAVGLFASDKPSGTSMDPASLRPEAAEALEWANRAYAERHGAEMTAPALAGFSGAWALVAHVLPAAGSDDPDSVADAAVRTKLEPGGLPNGSGLDLAGPGHPSAGANLRASSVIWQWVGPQQREVVWPPGFATHELVVPAA